jgi:hypothetical protein
VAIDRQAKKLDQLGERVSQLCARAERRIDDELAQATQRAEQATLRAEAANRRQREEAAARARRGDEVATPAATSEDAAAMERYGRAPNRLGLIERVRTWFAMWRQRRRYRGMLRRLDRGLARRDVRIADHSSAALLAVLTERIARLSNTTASPTELDETIAVVQHLSDEYRAYVARLAAARDAAGATSALRDKATAELARCEAGVRRIDDAMEQLRALARRRAPAPR